MTAEQLTAILAERIMGWRVGPERILKGGRSWEARWRFQPLHRVENAVQLLEKANARYTFDKAADGSFAARVTTDGQVGTASENSAAAALTIALARAIGIDVGGLD